jgi:hypothetical protein
MGVHYPSVRWLNPAAVSTLAHIQLMDSAPKEAFEALQCALAHRARRAM